MENLVGTETVIVEYTGWDKISAIKALRDLTGLGLKEAKDTIEEKDGFLMTAFEAATLRMNYFALAHGNRSHEDWRVRIHLLSKIDLRGKRRKPNEYMGETNFNVRPLTMEEVYEDQKEHSIGEILGKALRP